MGFWSDAWDAAKLIGKGIADVVYLPKDRFKLTDPAIIIELKWNKDTQTAIKQIEDKQYTAKYANYGNGFLPVGINYDTKTKKHSCEIKRLEKISFATKRFLGILPISPQDHEHHQ